MKVSISLPDELVRYIDKRVENRSRLVSDYRLGSIWLVNFDPDRP